MKPTKNNILAALMLLSAGTASAQWNTDSTEIDSYQRFRIGGYGEAVAAFKDYGTNRFYGGSEGNTRMHRNTISIPRFVLAGDYKFGRHWNIGVEVEFESGGTGTAYEIENSENGEYETEVEKGGEVAVEQFHLTYHLNQYFNVRAGHFIVPVGMNNAHHEPINFFGTVRPEGETSIIPNTWHETGLSFFGQVGRRWASFNWEAQIVAGLNANGFDRNNWVKKGKQGFFEVDNFTSPGYVARINYTGVPGLRLGNPPPTASPCPSTSGASTLSTSTATPSCAATSWAAEWATPRCSAHATAGRATPAPTPRRRPSQARPSATA